MRTHSRCLALVVLLPLAACWADFPDSRFNRDSRAGDTLPANPDGMSGPRESTAGAEDTTGSDLPLAEGQPADTLPPDAPVLDQLVVDTYICTASAFLQCKSQTVLEKCNSTGNGIQQVDCSPAKCDATLGRCDQCDPATYTSTCTGTDLTSCSTDGLVTTTSCSLGCSGGKCCLDSDGDKVSDCVGDCNDNDALVFPGQTTPQTVPSAGSFDYDCDGKETPESTATVSCLMSGSVCSGDGWVSTVPACGIPALFGYCTKKGNKCEQNDQTKVQGCL